MANLIIERENKKYDDLEYWRSKLAVESVELSLPFDHPRLPMSNFMFATHSFTIPISVNEKIQKLSHIESVNPSIIIMTIFKILLHRYSNEDDICIGTQVSKENQIDKMPLVNTLVMRTQLQGNMTFRDALQEVIKVVQEAYQYQVPFSQLVNEIIENQGDKTKPLFRVMLNIQNMELVNEGDNGEQIEITSMGHNVSQNDLILNVTEINNELEFSIVYDKNLFDRETIMRMTGHFTRLLEELLADSEISISRVPILTNQERHQLLVEWNESKVDFPRDSSIDGLFEEQVRLNPDNVALIFENNEMTYYELDIRANQIANYLRELNITKGQLVAICLDRSIDMIASILGVLKAGGGYVPIDLSYPEERIAYMLGDSGVSFVITKERIANALPSIDGRLICLDKEGIAISDQSRSNFQSGSTDADNLAYVMYTSGSTGKPKGVEIVHRGIVRLVKNITYANVGPEETFLNLAQASFDLSTFEIYGALLNGGKLVIMNSNKPTFEDIAETIKRNHITSLCVTSSRLNLLLEDYSKELASLRQIFSAGEALPVVLAERVLSSLKDCNLYNLYGPTENSVTTTSFHVNAIAPNTFSIPIGRPIANDNVFILDKYLQPVPIGIVGELYISGDGIARGYLNKTELTRERFPSNPFSDSEGGKLYRSGDLARFHSDGNIEFVRRVDDQVKIRGHRIELGEVENVVGTFPGVRQSVASTTKGKDGTDELVAYVVMNKGVSFDQKLIRSYALEKLPQQMIPTFFVELSEIPVTPVGKIDRKKLPAPPVTVSMEQIILPRNPIEEKLVKIWENLLDVKPIGVTDPYFELGGNSLLAMRMFSDIEKVFNKKLSASIIFQEDTIEQLARVIVENDQLSNMSIVPIHPLGNKPPLFCIHGEGGEVLVYKGLAFELGNDQPLYGLKFINIEDNKFISVEMLAEKYIKEIRKVQPIGPYHLFGYCFGGAIAHEMAHQLLEEGQKVSLLAILNFASPICKSIEINKVKISSKVNYRKIIINNMKMLFKMPIKQRASFFKRKVMNAFNLVNKTSNPTVGAEVVSTKSILRKAINAYKPSPYPDDMLLIRANDYIGFEEKLGWETTENGNVHEYNIQAEHEVLLKDPNVGLVVKYLKEYLEMKKQNPNRFVK